MFAVVAGLLAFALFLVSFPIDRVYSVLASSEPRGDLRLLVRTRHTCYDSDRNRHSGEAQAKPSHISQSDGMADDNYQRARKFVCFTRYDGMNGCNRSVTLKTPSVGTGAAPLPAGKILDKLCAFRYWETADFDCC